MGDLERWESELFVADAKIFHLSGEREMLAEEDEGAENADFELLMHYSHVLRHRYSYGLENRCFSANAKHPDKGAFSCKPRQSARSHGELLDSGSKNIMVHKYVTSQCPSSDASSTTPGTKSTDDLFSDI